MSFDFAVHFVQLPPFLPVPETLSLHDERVQRAAEEAFQQLRECDWISEPDDESIDEVPFGEVMCERQGSSQPIEPAPLEVTEEKGSKESLQRKFEAILGKKERTQDVVTSLLKIFFKLKSRSPRACDGMNPREMARFIETVRCAKTENPTAWSVRVRERLFRDSGKKVKTETYYRDPIRTVFRMSEAFGIQDWFDPVLCSSKRFEQDLVKQIQAVFRNQS